LEVRNSARSVLNLMRPWTFRKICDIGCQVPEDAQDAIWLTVIANGERGQVKAQQPRRDPVDSRQRDRGLRAEQFMEPTGIEPWAHW